MPPEGPGPPELLGATEETVVLVGDPSSVRLTVPTTTQRRLDDASTGGGRLFLTVEDIEAERDPGLVYAVYLNLPADGGALDAARHHVGNVSFFGIQQLSDPNVPHEGGAPALRHTFDVTDVMSTLRERDLWDPAGFTVTFEPVGVRPPPGEEESWQAEPMSDAARTPVKIGRVSLFVA
jgi:tyrosinase